MQIRDDEKNPLSLSMLISSIHLHNLENYYNKDYSHFKQQIDKLNLKFYFETEMYLNNNRDIEECQNKLFFILFQQISIYINEIERLNIILNKMKQREEYLQIERVAELNILNNLDILQSCKYKIIQLEKKLREKELSEEKYQKEIENLKFISQALDEKIKLGTTNKKDFINNKMIITTKFPSSKFKYAHTKTNSKDLTDKMKEIENLNTPYRKNLSDPIEYLPDHKFNLKNSINPTVFHMITNENKKNKLKFSKVKINLNLKNPNKSIEANTQSSTNHTFDISSSIQNKNKLKLSQEMSQNSIKNKNDAKYLRNDNLKAEDSDSSNYNCKYNRECSIVNPNPKSYSIIFININKFRFKFSYYIPNNM